MSDESFRDASEDYMPFDDDFVHNYMVHVHKTSASRNQPKAANVSKSNILLR